MIGQRDEALVQELLRVGAGCVRSSPHSAAVQNAVKRRYKSFFFSRRAREALPDCNLLPEMMVEMDIEQLLDLEQLEDEAIAERTATQHAISSVQQAAEEYRRTLEELNGLLSRQNARIAAGESSLLLADDKEEASDAHKVARAKPEWDAGESGARQPRFRKHDAVLRETSTEGECDSLTGAPTCTPTDLLTEYTPLVDDAREITGVTCLNAPPFMRMPSNHNGYENSYGNR